jgi:quercetin dioxygenase-like cupin family protein
MMKDIQTQPDAVEWLGTHYRTLLSARDANSTLSVVDIVSPPHSGPPRHIHHDADETFVILEGAFLFWLDGETHRRGPGETIIVPRGKEHTFRVISDTPSRHLIIMTPGGFEDFFVEMAQGAMRIPEDMAKVVEIGHRYELEFTGPPLTE